MPNVRETAEYYTDFGLLPDNEQLCSAYAAEALAPAQEYGFSTTDGGEQLRLVHSPRDVHRTARRGEHLLEARPRCCGVSPDSLLDTYTPERVPHLRGFIDFPMELCRVICLTDPDAAAKRDRQMMAALANPASTPAPPPAPRLGPGLLDAHSDAAGIMSIQAPVEAATTSGLLDDVLSGGACLLLAQLAVDGEAAPGLGIVSWRVLAPDGSEAGSGTLGGSFPFHELNSFTETGTYLLTLVPGATGGGALTVRLTTVPPESTGTVVVDGPAVTVDFAPGQDARRTFRGAVGQRLWVRGSNSSTLGDVDYSVAGPDGNGAGVGRFYSAGTYDELYRLSSSGTYTIRLHPYGSAHGQLQLHTIEPDTNGSLVLGQRSAVTFSTGQNASRTLPCSAGQQLRVTGTTSASLTPVDYELLEPDGRAALHATFAAGGGTTTDTSYPIVTSGTCTLRLDPEGDGAGRLQLRIAPYTP